MKRIKPEMNYCKDCKWHIIAYCHCAQLTGEYNDPVRGRRPLQHACASIRDKFRDAEGEFMKCHHWAKVGRFERVFNWAILWMFK